MIPTSVPSFNSDLAAFLGYLITQIEKLGVDIGLMREATPELIQEMSPDEIIIATGATSIIPELPGIAQEKVITSVDALLGKKDVGNNVVVVGGGQVGCETAVWLAQEGKRVTIVELLSDILQDMFFSNKMMLVEMLDKAGVSILTDAMVSGINDEGIIIQKEGGPEILKADTVVLAVGMKSQGELFDNLEDKLENIHAVGDCVEPNKLMQAIWQAYRVTQLI